MKSMPHEAVSVRGLVDAGSRMTMRPHRSCLADALSIEASSRRAVTRYGSATRLRTSRPRFSTAALVRLTCLVGSTTCPRQFDGKWRSRSPRGSGVRRRPWREKEQETGSRIRCRNVERRSVGHVRPTTVRALSTAFARRRHGSARARARRRSRLAAEAAPAVRPPLALAEVRGRAQD